MSVSDDSSRKNRWRFRVWFHLRIFLPRHPPIAHFAFPSIRYFKQAAEHGSADAQFNLGSMYFAGLGGIAADAPAALKYFALAAQQGHTRSIYNLAQMHLHGMATPKSCAVSDQHHCCLFRLLLSLFRVLRGNLVFFLPNLMSFACLV
jgi:hypothetical protein